MRSRLWIEISQAKEIAEGTLAEVAMVLVAGAPSGAHLEKRSGGSDYLEDEQNAGHTLVAYQNIPGPGAS